MLDIRYLNKDEARRFLRMFTELTIGGECEQDAELRKRKDEERFDRWCEDIIAYLNDVNPDFEEMEVAFEWESWYGTARVWLSCFRDEDDGSKCVNMWPDLYYSPIHEDDYHTDLYYEEEKP